MFIIHEHLRYNLHATNSFAEPLRVMLNLTKSFQEEVKISQAFNEEKRTPPFADMQRIHGAAIHRVLFNSCNPLPRMACEQNHKFQKILHIVTLLFH